MTQSQTVVIDEQAQGQRLDVVLAASQGTTRSAITRLFTAGVVQVNGQAVKAGYIPQVGDKVVLEPLVHSPATTQPKPPPSLPIVFENAEFLIIDKPAGLVVHPARTDSRDGSVLDAIRDKTTDPDPDRPGIVHRLDRDTSGLLVVAKTAEAKAYLQSQFKARLIQKKYLALVCGHPKLPEATVKLPIARAKANPTKRVVASSGRDAETAYVEQARYSGFSLLEVAPKTGRTHQIRVHLAHLGHPVAGDSVYGGKTAVLKRQFLHATELDFSGPDGQAYHFTSPLPPELAVFLAKLEEKV